MKSDQDPHFPYSVLSPRHLTNIRVKQHAVDILLTYAVFLSTKSFTYFSLPAKSWCTYISAQILPDNYKSDL